MASRLGVHIRRARDAKGLGLRELARRIGKSPAYLVSIERADPPPGISEDTLRELARALDTEVDVLLTLAAKTPKSVRPRTATEMALYRLVRALPKERQEQLLRQLKKGSEPEDQ